MTLSKPEMTSSTGSNGEILAPALDRGLAVLSAIAASTDATTVGMLSSHLKTPRSSMARIVKTLIEEGYVSQDRLGGLRPSFASVRLAHSYIRSLPIWSEARVALRELARQTGCAVQLMIRDGDEVVVAAQQTPEKSGRSPLGCRIGARLSTLHTDWLTESFDIAPDSCNTGGVFAILDTKTTGEPDRKKCLMLVAEIESVDSWNDTLMVGMAVYDIDPLDRPAMIRALRATAVHLSDFWKQL
jgi:predicted transcriptional regulator